VQQRFFARSAAELIFCSRHRGRRCTWWWANIDLDKSGKTQDLIQADREVTIEVTSGNAAGTGDVVEQKITWKVTKIGESRQETRYKTVDGQIVPYTVTVKDHLIQIGDRSTSSRPRAASRGKMIVAADANICYVEDPPPPTRVQITNSQYPWPEVWKEADTAQRPSPNWVHTFDAEGQWVSENIMLLRSMYEYGRGCFWVLL